MLRLAAAGILFLSAVSLRADTPVASLRAGDKAPSFTAVDDRGKPWNSADYVGKQVVVVYFYPADLTRQCTQQACSFRDRQQQLKAAGITVVGVSGDSVNNHRLFKSLHTLNYPLLADPEGRVAKAFGVPIRAGGEITRIVGGRQKKLKRGVTAHRWTFVIGLDGRIVSRNTDVRAESDGESVLNVVRQLTASTQ
jgi:peroxiredoxin Q/BCP